MKGSKIFCLAIATGLILSACGGEKEVKKDEKKQEPTTVTVKSDQTKSDAAKKYTPPTGMKTVRIDSTAQKQKTQATVETPKSTTLSQVPTDQTIKSSVLVPDTTGGQVKNMTQVVPSPTAVSAESKSAAPSVINPQPKAVALSDTTTPKAPYHKLREAQVSRATLGSLLLDDIFFDANETATPSLAFNSNYLITLSKVVKALKSDPQVNVRLTGHTMKLGDQFEKDKNISLKRAITVGKLVLGLFPADEKESIAYRIEVVPAGSEDLLIEGNNRVKEMLNHRVSIELIEGNPTGSTLADFVYPERVAETSAQRTEKPAIRATIARSSSGRATTQDMIYNNGQKLFRQKKYNEAISTFEELVSLSPQNALADNAQWWIGECHYAQGDFVEALNAYQKVFELGDRNKSAYAQLRMGYCYEHLNQPDMAKSAWEKVIQNYPNASEEVTKAKKVLYIAGTK